MTKKIIEEKLVFEIDLEDELKILKFLNLEGINFSSYIKINTTFLNE